MNKKLIIILLILISLSGCKAEKEQWESYKIIMESGTNKPCYQLIEKQGTIYIRDVLLNSDEEYCKKIKESKPALVNQLDYIDGSVELDTLDEIAPYTYSIENIDVGFKVLNSFLVEEYEVESYFATYQYIDYYLVKDSIITRIILFKNKIKVFRDIKVIPTHSWTYISRQIIGGKSDEHF